MKRITLLSLMALAACGPTTPTDDAGTGGGGNDNLDGAGGDGGHQEHLADLTRGRLVVADGADASVAVLDLDDGTVVGSFTLQGTASVNAEATDENGLAFLVESKVNLTEVVSSGLTFEAHGDHFHIAKAAPSLSLKSIPCSKPSHLVMHEGWFSIFNDGTGAIAYQKVSNIALGSFDMLNYATGLAHHGVALLFKDMLVATIPDPVDPTPGTTRRPIGVSARMAANPATGMGEFTGCPLLHGEAASSNRLAFGCGDGALVLSWNGTAFESKHLANPAGSAAGLRISSLLGHEGLDVFVGNFGSEALSIVDPAASTITATPLPSKQLNFELFGAEHLIVLTLDGKLNKLDPRTGGAQAPALELIPAYTAVPSGEGAVKPGLALGVDRAYVSDPRSGLVHEVDVEGWKVERTFTVGGSPATMRVVSASADFHSH